MKAEKNDLGKAQIELKIELSPEEFAPYIKKGAEQVSREVKIEGFRPGHVPIEILKQKIGEMTILEEAAHIAIHKTLDQAIKENISEQIVGQPKVDIIKLAPGNPFEYKVLLAILPQIKLGDYKNINIKEKKIEIKEADITKLLDELRELRAKEAVVDREIKETDKAIFDVEMFLDNVPIEGGQHKSVTVLLGKNYFVPGFDKKVLGMKKNDTREFKLPYPDDYHMKNLAGKMVEFKVKAIELYERIMPELNDDLAAAFGLKKLDELKDNIKKSLEEQKAKEARTAEEREMLEKLIEKTKFGDIPQILVESEAQTMMAELEQSVTGQGGNMTEYLQTLKKSYDQLTLDMLPEAVKRVKVSLMIREIANQENIKLTESELEEHIKDMKKHYQNQPEVLERLNSPEYKSYVTNVLTSRKVIDKLREWNVTKN